MFNSKKSRSDDAPAEAQGAPAEVPTLMEVVAPPAAAPERPAPQPAAQPAPRPVDKGDGGGMPSVFGPSVNIQGSLNFGGRLHLEGGHRGGLQGQSLNVGPTGRVEGDIVVDRLVLEGLLHGTAVCQSISIGARAIARGEVTCHSLSLSRGATLEGRVRIGKGVPAPATASPAAGEASPGSGKDS